jgi:oligopeptide transport system substrate-binding protein
MIENAPAILAGDAAPQELGVAATNDHMLEIRLANPTPYFPQLLTHPATAPLHRETIERFADRATRPEHSVSNGAYRIVRYDIASLIVLDKNPHSRESDTVKIDQVFYHAIVSDAAMYNRYRAGDLDITFSIPSGSYQSIMAERPTELKIAPQLGVYYYGLNLTKPPFKDNPKLRAALSMVIDRETLVEKITGRGELPAYSWVPPGIDGYDPPGFPYQHSDLDARLEIARKLYAEAGFSEENPARFELRFNTGEGESKMALAIQSIWKQSLGAEVTLVNEEFKVLISNIKQMEVTESFRLSWIGDYFDPNTFLELMETGNPQNLTGYSNPRFDKLMSRAASETNSIKRMAILRDAESLMLSDHPVIPLYYYVSKHLVRNEIRGWTNTLVDFHPTRSLWIDRKQK